MNTKIKNKIHTKIISYKQLYENEVNKNNILLNSIINKNNIIKNLELKIKQLELKNKLIDKSNPVNKENKNIICESTQKLKKGSMCSKNGYEYEKKIFDILQLTKLNNKKFNTQDLKDLGGSSSRNDIECNLHIDNDIGIEIKKYNTPDWMQCTITYKNNKWITTDKGKIPHDCRIKFNTLLENVMIFDNKLPPFINKSLTYDEWIEIKKNDKTWNDMYIDIPNTIIRNLYKLKDCYYIQVSDYGLYHLGHDICNFNVPEFTLDQKMRIRIKVHTKKNTKGFCNLSITASCLPKDIRQLNKSPYSLDDKNKLPVNLYIIN